METAHFNERIASDYGVAPRAFSSSAMAALEDYDWPGNVQELECVVERLFALELGPSIQAEDLPPEIGTGGGGELPRDPQKDCASASVSVYSTWVRLKGLGAAAG